MADGNARALQLGMKSQLKLALLRQFTNSLSCVVNSNLVELALKPQVRFAMKFSSNRLGALVIRSNGSVLVQSSQLDPVCFEVCPSTTQKKRMADKGRL